MEFEPLYDKCISVSANIKAFSILRYESLFHATCIFCLTWELQNIQRSACLKERQQLKKMHFYTPAMLHDILDEVFQQCFSEVCFSNKIFISLLFTKLKHKHFEIVSQIFFSF